jgi:protein phosphatase PTC7
VGVDPSEFAWGIMNQSKNQIDHHQKEDLLEILSEGYKTLKDKKLVKAGSSTIALLSVELGKAKVLNLGDSGFRLFRDNKLIYRTHEQQYFFNAPYQLSILLESDSKKGSLQTQPDQSFRDEITLEDKDILLLGTDGLFDNLGDEKLVEIIKTENSLENKIDLMLKTALAIKTNKMQINKVTITIMMTINMIVPMLVKPLEIKDCLKWNLQKNVFDWQRNKDKELEIVDI